MVRTADNAAVIVADVYSSADARLIAAAPTLYEAALARLEELRTWAGERGLAEITPLAPSDALVIAAIKQVRGEL
jgi:hypothetical protein